MNPGFNFSEVTHFHTAAFPQKFWASKRLRSPALKNVFLQELNPHKKMLGKRRDQLQKVVDAAKAGLVHWPVVKE